MATLPRLGDTSSDCTACLGQPLAPASSGCRDGFRVQQYPSSLAPLTVLFDHDRSVAFYLRYPSPRPQAAAVRAAVAHLATSGGVPRLLIDDEGWFLAATTCSAAALDRFARAVLSEARQAQVATWEQAQTDWAAAGGRQAGGPQRRDAVGRSRPPRQAPQ